MKTGFVITRKHWLVTANAHVADMLNTCGSLTVLVNDKGKQHKIDRG